MRKLWIWLVCCPLWVMAQEAEPFTADRPGTTGGVDVLPKGRLQWETGFAWQREEMGEMTETTWTINTSALRWGFSDTAELRLQAAYFYTVNEEECHGGFGDVSIGTKVKLFEGWKAVPKISMVASVAVGGGNDAEFMPQEWGGLMALVFQHQLTPWMTLGYEGDLIWQDSGKPTKFYGVCLGFDLSDKVSIGVEEFNYAYPENSVSQVGLSLGWQVAKRLQLDFQTDISLNDPGNYKNIMVGLSWQLTKR